MSNKVLLFFCTIILLSSCVKQIDGPIEIPLSPYPKIEINLDQPNEYRNKVYYDLASQTIVKTSNSLDWNIAFASNINSTSKIIQNYALGISCNGFTKMDTAWSRKMSEEEFISNTLLFANHYDSFANLFQSNFNANTNLGYVYYLNFGKYSPFVKFQILSFTATEVQFRYAYINGTNERQHTIGLNPNLNYNYFSFPKNGLVDIEPIDKNSWDLEFTHYTTLVTEFNDTRMYGVTGVLNNPAKNIGVAQLDNLKIEELDSTRLASYNYSKELGKIGYSWKKFSNGSQDGFYTILPRTYVVSNDNQFYGIQFVEYSKIVNNTSVKGYPTFLLRKF